MYSQLMSKILHTTKGRSLIAKYYISRKFGNTHYDTLHLPRTCTPKEIKEAFIKLSKTCHPDHNQNDPETHARFVKLNEAYQVLSRPEARRDYDLSLSYIPHSTPQADVYSTAPQEKVTWDQSFWEKRDKSKDRKREEDNYYGIKGFRRIRSGWIAFFLIVISAFGTALQLVALHSGFTFSRKQLNQREKEASKALADLRAQKEHLSKEEHFELMKKQLGGDRFESRSETSARQH